MLELVKETMNKETMKDSALLDQHPIGQGDDGRLCALSLESYCALDAVLYKVHGGPDDVHEGGGFDEDAHTAVLHYLVKASRRICPAQNIHEVMPLATCMPIIVPHSDWTGPLQGACSNDRDTDSFTTSSCRQAHSYASGDDSEIAVWDLAAVARNLCCRHICFCLRKEPKTTRSPETKCCLGKESHRKLQRSFNDATEAEGSESFDRFFQQIGT